jgi:hypothetical protein
MKECDIRHYYEKQHEVKYSLVNLGKNKISQLKTSSGGQHNIFKKQSKHNLLIVLIT